MASFFLSLNFSKQLFCFCDVGVVLELHASVLAYIRMLCHSFNADKNIGKNGDVIQFINGYSRTLDPNLILKFLREKW